jgi:trans-2,3-dihydro-3-hydroxyanthranilate isomerase
MMSSLPVTIVHACMRDGSGGSPTAVLEDALLTDAERCRIPALMGTSHAVFVSVDDSRGDGAPVPLRFFTAAGELPACGHGTVAALAFLAARSGDPGYRATLRTSARVFEGWAVRDGDVIDAAFEVGAVDLREPTADECSLVLPALGLADDDGGPGVRDSTHARAHTCVRVASVGRERLLVPVPTRSALDALFPDFDRLRAACDQFGFLGCYVYSAPTATGRIAARMFAPSIGVPEDIANANSTACLAAHLAEQGVTEIAVDMGDGLGSPATITAAARPAAAGRLIHLGGAAALGPDQPVYVSVG